MRINHKILSIPPYISTPWKNVLALKTAKIEEKLELQITLSDGSSISIPETEDVIIEAVFTAHARYLDAEPQIAKVIPPSFLHSGFGKLAVFSESESPLASDMTKMLSQISSFWEHDPEKGKAPDLPRDMIEQFKHVAGSLPFSDPQKLPQPEPHCNCPHCQITRALHTGLQVRESFEEFEPVAEQDLNFPRWIIQSMPGQAYKVINPDNTDEYYFVSLASPLHCTCGAKNCEHMEIVLKS